ncbi:hypothetical protein [Burkholderia ubonensis]|uniref:hypothetical protein n=1 Tax=Burkholderia ubonensis TaxID=101571 RepID=UPI000AB4DD5C|nr:hypothetical protein [Burkholderia ubonensis]
MLNILRQYFNYQIFSERGAGNFNGSDNGSTPMEAPNSSLSTNATSMEDADISTSINSIDNILDEFNKGKASLVSVQNEHALNQRKYTKILDLDCLQNLNSERCGNFYSNLEHDPKSLDKKYNFSGSVLGADVVNSLYCAIGNSVSRINDIRAVLPKFIQSKGIDKSSPDYDTLLEKYDRIVINATMNRERCHPQDIRDLRSIKDYIANEKYLLAGLTSVIFFNSEDVSIQNAFESALGTGNRRFSTGIKDDNNAYSFLDSIQSNYQVHRDKKFKVSKDGGLIPREDNQKTLISLQKHIAKHDLNKSHHLTELLFLVNRQNIRDGISVIAVDLSSGEGFASMDKSEVERYLDANQDLFKILKKDIGDLPCAALYYDKESNKRQLVKIEWNEQGAYIDK